MKQAPRTETMVQRIMTDVETMSHGIDMIPTNSKSSARTVQDDYDTIRIEDDLFAPVAGHRATETAAENEQFDCFGEVFSWTGNEAHYSR